MLPRDAVVEVIAQETLNLKVVVEEAIPDREPTLPILKKWAQEEEPAVAAASNTLQLCLCSKTSQAGAVEIHQEEGALIPIIVVIVKAGVAVDLSTAKTDLKGLLTVACP